MSRKFKIRDQEAVHLSPSRLYIGWMFSFVVSTPLAQVFQRWPAREQEDLCPQCVQSSWLKLLVVVANVAANAGGSVTAMSLLVYYFELHKPHQSHSQRTLMQRSWYAVLCADFWLSSLPLNHPLSKLKICHLINATSNLEFIVVQSHVTNGWTWSKKPIPIARCIVGSSIYKKMDAMSQDMWLCPLIFM